MLNILSKALILPLHKITKVEKQADSSENPFSFFKGGELVSKK